jgi:2-polyprenyl-3-methyl-5-hydroxy-6-metoxy-1,4-benzoquinol methylase
MGREILEKCPLCNQTVFEAFLECRDHTASRELFTLQRCLSCSFVFTNPRPDKASLPNYYQSPQYISHTGKSSGGIIGWAYLLARNFTIRWKARLIGNYKKKISILDYGCGTGELLRQYRAEGWQIAGVEPSAQARQKATEITGINIASDLKELDNQMFDVITLWHVLEHIADFKETLTALKHLLKKDGLLLLAVPNHESLDAQFYKEYWAGYDVPRHLSHFTKTSMAALLRTEGLVIQSILPMNLDAYYVSLLSQQYKSSQALTLTTFLKGIYHGFISNRKARSSVNHSSLIYLAAQ